MYIDKLNEIREPNIHKQYQDETTLITVCTLIMHFKDMELDTGRCLRCYTYFEMYRNLSKLRLW